MKLKKIKRMKIVTRTKTSLFASLKKVLTLPDKNYETLKKNKKLFKDQQMGTHIYKVDDKNNKVDYHVKKFHKIHFVFKYKLWVPVLYVAKRLLGKSLEQKVPDTLYNKNIQIFNDSFEKAMVRWNMEFRRSTQKQNKYSISKAKQVMKNDVTCSGTLQTMKDCTLTIALNDTAYREFLNIWMFEQAKMMNEYYSKHPIEAKKHLFYTHNNIYDPHYFYVWQNRENYQMVMSCATCDLKPGEKK